MTGAGLALLVKERGHILNLNNANSYGGGTAIAIGSNVAPQAQTAVVNVNHNQGLGTGFLTTSFGGGANENRVDINFTTAAPVIGSLSGSGVAGGTHITLGASTVNTLLTINQSTAGTYSGTINQFAGQTGSIFKSGAEALTLSGVNTYTGNTTVNVRGIGARLDGGTSFPS